MSGLRFQVSGWKTLVSIRKPAPIPRTFFNRDARKVARDLLGKVVVRREGRTTLAGRIVEVEAYLGVNDPAAHAAAGRTARNQVLFGPPGHAYVYFIYGNHYCLNFSCANMGCVLIRALEPLSGLARMAQHRGLELDDDSAPNELRLLTSGPGRLCQALAITRARDNGTDVTARGDLFLVEDGFRPKKIALTTRIGIVKAAEEKLRYAIAGNAFVSGKRV